MGSKSSYRLDSIAQKAYEDLYKKREEDVKGIKEIIDEFKYNIPKDSVIKYKITIKDIKNHTNEEKNILMQINNKFDTSFTYNDEYINISYFKEDFGDEYFKIFSNVRWENIIELKLRNNNIYEIAPLLNINLLNLKKLDLSNNYISEIDDFDQIEFKCLKYINLRNNKIDYPFVFCDSRFENLGILILEDNDIDDETKKRFLKKYKSKNKSQNLILLL